MQANTSVNIPEELKSIFEDQKIILSTLFDESRPEYTRYLHILEESLGLKPTKSVGGKSSRKRKYFKR